MVDKYYTLYSITYDSELHTGSYKECLEVKRNIIQCNKDMNLPKETFKIYKETYSSIIVVKRK